MANELQQLKEKYVKSSYDENVSNKEFAGIQKLVFKKAIHSIKINPDNPPADADLLVGWIGLEDGDRFKIPPQNVLAHLERAWKNGSSEAGILLYRAHNKMYQYIPNNMRSLSRGILILEKMIRERNDQYALFELVEHYLRLIESYFSEEGSEDPPEDHYHKAYQYASLAFEQGYPGGYLHMGIFTYYGFIGLVPKDISLAYKYFFLGLKKCNENPRERDVYSVLKYWVGYCQVHGLGVSMDRESGLKIIHESATMGNIEAKNWLEENREFVDAIESSKLEESEYYMNDPDIINTHEFDILSEYKEPKEILGKLKSSKLGRDPMSFFLTNSEDEPVKH